jgi:hypothetical protein
VKSLLGKQTDPCFSNREGDVWPKITRAIYLVLFVSHWISGGHGLAAPKGAMLLPSNLVPVHKADAINIVDRDPLRLLNFKEERRVGHTHCCLAAGLFGHDCQFCILNFWTL